MMTEKLSEKTCDCFTSELASRAPVPGGGSVAALLGALSAALCAMAAGISGARAKEPLTGEALALAAEKADGLRLRALALIDADAEDLGEYIAMLRGSGKSVATVSRSIASIKCLYSHLLYL